MAVEEEQEAGIPEWIVTFGDMMSLLLTFFIMLFSMSEIKDEQLYQAVMEALRKQFGFDASSVSMIPGDSKPRNSRLDKRASMGRARRANTMNGGDKVKAPVGDYPRVEAIRKGQHATRGGVLLFEEGSTELTEENKWKLEDIADEIGGKLQKIEIRGHTSPRPLPPGSPYKDHWDLAYARCCLVKDFLVDLGINSQRLRLDVAADNEPRHVGPDPLLLKENPRVEIFTLDEFVGDLRGSTGEERSSRSPKSAP